MDILNKIENLRCEKGWSYYTLALESGLTQSTLTNMFARGTQPSVKTLTALCEAFGISLSEFFSEDLKIPVRQKKMKCWQITAPFPPNNETLCAHF